MAQHKKTWIIALTSAAILPLMGGCGGGSKSGDTKPSAALSTRSAAINLSLTWPAPVAGKDRAFPVAARSIVVSVRDSTNFTDSRTLVRPAAADSNQTVSASFIGLSPGATNITATAYTTGDGTGTPLSVTTAQVTLQSGQQGVAALDFPNPFVTLTLAPAQATFLRGSTVTFSATGTDDRNRIFTNVPGTFTSADPAVATVNASGAIVGVGAGTTTITFTDSQFGKTATVPVTVQIISQVTLLPALPAPLLQGSSLKFAATGRDTSGAIVQENPPGTWTSSNRAAATVDATGNVTGVGIGTANITFTDTVFNQSVTVPISIIGIDQISVTPTATLLAFGQTVALTATGQNTTGGTVQANPPGTWSTDNPVVATVDATGKVTAIGAGKATITFRDTVFGKTGAATITVRGGDASVIVQ